MAFNTSERLVILGQTGSGKTYYCMNKLLPGITRFIVYDCQYEYSDLGRCVHSIPELKEASKKSLRIIYQPLKENIDKDFNPVCNFIVSYIRGVVFIVDEVHLFAPNNVLPKPLKIVLTTGRKLGIGFIGISQRPQLINKTIITQAQHTLVFNVTAIDMEYLKGYLGSGLDHLTTMPKYSYAYSNEGNLEFCTP